MRLGIIVIVSMSLGRLGKVPYSCSASERESSFIFPIHSFNITSDSKLAEVGYRWNLELNSNFKRKDVTHRIQWILTTCA